MQKIVINTCFGGFGLSVAAKAWFKERGLDVAYDRDIPRDSKLLVKCVETLGSSVASGDYGSLKVVEVPDGVNWQIEEYDGNEHIAEKHETWY